MLPPSRHREDKDQPRGGDAAIRLTDSDAALARLSAVQKHYLADNFVKYFIPRAHLQPPRPPLINIGTYLRSEALDELVNQWLELSEVEGRPCQIISLGAGSDTRFWRIAVRSVCFWFFVEILCLGLTREFYLERQGLRRLGCAHMSKLTSARTRRRKPWLYAKART